jgi:putative endonuclease
MTPSGSTKSFGQHGEQLAVNYLKQRSYSIVTTNWRCKQGEIDIIASRGDTLVFVEVRTRHAASSEPAFESITPRKRAKLIALAHTYLAAYPANTSPWRIDVIAIGISRSGVPIIEHTEDALDW